MRVFAFLLAVAASAQQYEVASIKPNKGCETIPRAGNLSPSPGRLEMPCVNLQNLLQAAYGTFGDGVTVNTQPLPMEGGPSWMSSEFYRFSAKADGPVRTEQLAGPMLQAFLADRFQLKAHMETREKPVYALTVGKGGLKVEPLAAGACTPLDLSHPPAPPGPKDGIPNLCGIMMMGPGSSGTTMSIDVRGVTMKQFAQRLSGRLDRTVIDKTGVAGMYNFRLEFVPDPSIRGQAMPPRPPGDTTAAPAAADPSVPGLFAALQEQTGLKLSADRGPVPYLVIEHVEKPTAN